MNVNQNSFLLFDFAIDVSRRQLFFRILFVVTFICANVQLRQPLEVGYMQMSAGRVCDAHTRTGSYHASQSSTTVPFSLNMHPTSIADRSVSSESVIENVHEEDAGIATTAAAGNDAYPTTSADVSYPSAVAVADASASQPSSRPPSATHIDSSMRVHSTLDFSSFRTGPVNEYSPRPPPRYKAHWQASVEFEYVPQRRRPVGRDIVDFVAVNNRLLAAEQRRDKQRKEEEKQHNVKSPLRPPLQREEKSPSLQSTAAMDTAALAKGQSSHSQLDTIAAAEVAHDVAALRPDAGAADFASLAAADTSPLAAAHAQTADAYAAFVRRISEKTRRATSTSEVVDTLWKEVSAGLQLLRCAAVCGRMHVF